MSFCRASTTASVLSALDAKLNAIAGQCLAEKQRQQEYERQLQSNLKEVFDKQKEKGLTGSIGDRAGSRKGTQLDRENMMDVDDADSRGKNRKFVICLLHVPICSRFTRASHDLKPVGLRKRNKI